MNRGRARKPGAVLIKILLMGFLSFNNIAYAEQVCETVDFDRMTDPDDWVKIGKDSSKSRYVSFQIEPPLELSWEMQAPPALSDVGATWCKEMLSSEGVLVLLYSGVGKGTHHLYGFNAFTGEEIWEKHNSRFVIDPGAIDDGRYYLKVFDGGGPVTDIHTGAVRISIPLGPEWGSIQGVYGTNLYPERWASPISGAWDIHTAKSIWGSRRLPREYSSVFYNNMYFLKVDLDDNSYDQSGGTDIARYDLIAYNASTGNEKWCKEGLYSASSVKDNVLYTSNINIADNTGTFYAFNAETGDEIWNVPMPLSYRSGMVNGAKSPGISKNIVVFHSINKPSIGVTKYVKLAGIDKITGEIKWNFSRSFMGSSINNFAVSSDYVYLISDHYFPTGSTLFILDINTGEELQRVSVPGTSSIIRHNYMIIANKQLYVFHLEDLIGSDPHISVYKGQNPAAIARDNQVAEVGQSISLDAGYSFTGSGKSIISYSWDLGDGTTKQGETITHSYNSPGKYEVTLTIRDSQGQEDKDTIWVRVSSPLSSSKITSAGKPESWLEKTSDNALALIYQDESGKIVYKTSLDEGINWSGSKDIYNQSVSLMEVIKDQNDNIFILFREGSEEKLIELRYQSSGSWTVQSPRTLPESSSYASSLKIMVNSNEKLWYSFNEQIGIKGKLFSFSDDKGTTWSEPQQATIGQTYGIEKIFLWSDRPAVIGGGGDLGLYYLDENNVWQKGSTAKTGMYLYPLRSLGDLFEAATTDNNHIHIVYYGGDSIKYISKDNTPLGVWSSPINIANNRQDRFPEVVSKGNNLLVYWEEYQERVKGDRHYNLVFKEWTSANGWDKEPRVIANIHPDVNHNLQTLPRLADSLTEVPFVWSRGKENPYNIYFKQVPLNVSLPNANAGPDQSSNRFRWRRI